MDETQGSNREHPKKTKRTPTITLNRNLFFAGVAILILVLVFFLGSAYGGSKQKTSTKQASDSSDDRPSSNRWTSVGTVLEVSDSSIKIVDSRKQEKTTEITKDTKIVNRKGESLKSTDIKKDQRVIISGEKDGDKLTATRIRLQE